jgi:hypothetical protein
MKKKSYLLLGMAAILPTLTSCSSEDAVTGGADASGVTRVSLAATINKDATSRVEITENDGTNLNQGLIENWSTSDAIYVKNVSALTGDPWTLTKSTAGAGLTTATFTGDLQVADGATLLGYYPDDTLHRQRRIQDTGQLLHAGRHAAQGAEDGYHGRVSRLYSYRYDGIQLQQHVHHPAHTLQQHRRRIQEDHEDHRRPQ